MVAPTAAQIDQWSLVDFAGLGFNTTQLQVMIERIVEQVEEITGRTFPSMPDNLDKTAEQAIQMLVEQAAYQAQPDQIETTSDFWVISGFSAGSYSETRRGLEEIRKSGLLNPNPALHGLLWALMTQEKRDEWIALTTGVNAPAFAVTEVDWSYWAGASYLEGFPYGSGYG